MAQNLTFPAVLRQSGANQLDVPGNCPHTCLPEGMAELNRGKTSITESEIEFFKNLASSYFADADTPVECSICHDPVPLWEGLFVMYRFVGEIAHFQCPYEAFRASTCQTHFNPGFDYEGFCSTLDARVSGVMFEDNQSVSGEYEYSVEDKDG